MAVFFFIQSSRVFQLRTFERAVPPPLPRLVPDGCCVERAVRPFRCALILIVDDSTHNQTSFQLNEIFFFLLAADGPFPGVLSRTFQRSRIFSDAIVVMVLPLFINGSRKIDRSECDDFFLFRQNFTLRFFWRACCSLL